MSVETSFITFISLIGRQGKKHGEASTMEQKYCESFLALLSLMQRRLKRAKGRLALIRFNKYEYLCTSRTSGLVFCTMWLMNMSGLLGHSTVNMMS